MEIEERSVALSDLVAAICAILLRASSTERTLRPQKGAEGSNWHARPPLSFPQRAARNQAYRKAASHHAVAVRKFNEATVHLSWRENPAQLAVPVLSVPSVDVREVLHYFTPSKLEGR